MSDQENQLIKQVFRATLTVVGTVSLLYVLFESSMIVLSTLIGIGMAALLAPVVHHLESKYQVPRFAATIAMLFGLSIVFIIIIFLMGSIIFDQYESLRDSAPEIIAAWESRWDKLVDSYPKAAKALEKSQPLGLAKTTMSYIGAFMTALVSFFTGLSLALVISLFTTTNSKRYFKGFVSFFPESKQENVKQNLLIAGKVLRKWFSAQLVDMVAVSVLTMIGLWLVDIEYWALYGLLAGALSIIPYFGVIAVMTASGAVVAVQQPDRLLYLVAVFGITQQIEGNFILPKLMKDQVHVPAAPLIFFMILAGSWFGPLGVFVTPPLTAIGVALYRKNRTGDDATSGSD